MRSAAARLVLAVASMAAVVLFVLWDSERTSPGPLSSTHAALPELAGPDGCAGCHGEGEQGMARACSLCHGEVAQDVALGEGLHGSLDRARAEACAACHVEHHGDELPLVGRLTFAGAGIPERDAFDHGHVEFGLTGAHARLACVECHAHADDPVLAEGELRFLGLEQECSGCHDDPHEGRFARGCATCHGQEQPFAAVASFAHGQAFPLVGAHARPACLDCHPKGSAHGIEALAGHGPAPPSRACADCHESPHAAGFLAGVAELIGAAPGASCAACHDAAHASFPEGATMTPQQHAAAGFPLDAPHDDVACSACHAGAPEGGFAERYPGRGASACRSCHGDPHGGEFREGPFARAGCLACHERQRFDPPAFDARLHARTAFPLTGAHATLACDECHAPAPPPARVRSFAGAPRECSACHDDVHGAGFVAQARGRGCAACHSTASFADVDRPAFDHARSTRFALDGAHARASCEACHVPRAAPDERGRRFGAVADTRPGPPERCETCHEDAHRGAFDPPERPAGIPGIPAREGCARCHGTESFRRLEGGAFDHGAWTGFALAGAHDAIACESCHGPPPEGEARRLGRAGERFPGPRERCDTCHADVHGGAFARPGAGAALPVDCGACHSPAGFETVERFDHGAWTGFALEGAHGRASCAACHVLPARERGGMRLGLARGPLCADCHADPHVGQFARGGRTDCARCHASGEDFAEVRFDHAASRFALDAAHARLACAACHRPWPLPGGGEAVRYKPLGTRCVDCHATDGRADGR